LRTAALVTSESKAERDFRVPVELRGCGDDVEPKFDGCGCIVAAFKPLNVG
jgi:hypothetical protein